MMFVLLQLSYYCEIEPGQVHCVLQIGVLAIFLSSSNSSLSPCLLLLCQLQHLLKICTSCLQISERALCHFCFSVRPCMYGKSMYAM